MSAQPAELHSITDAGTWKGIFFINSSLAMAMGLL